MERKKKKKREGKGKEKKGGYSTFPLAETQIRHWAKILKSALRGQPACYATVLLYNVKGFTFLLDTGSVTLSSDGACHTRP